MALLSARRKTDPDLTVDLISDDRGHLFVNAGDLDSVQGGESYFDKDAVLPDVPNNGQLVFGVDDDDIIHPFRFNENNELKVTSDLGEVNITIPPLQPIGTPNRSVLFSKYFTPTGASDTKVDLNLDGSVTPKFSYITADPTGDIYITYIQILMLDGSINLAKFGAIPELSVGWSVRFISNGESVNLIFRAKSGGDIIAQTSPTNPFGNQGTVNVIPNFRGSLDALIISIDLTAFHPFGIRIGRGNPDKVEIQNNDDLTGLEGFSVRAIGYKVVS